jgi:S1-C subfamily serine protease
MQPVAFPEGTRKSLSLNAERGLLVVAVAAGSPADKAAILLGDIIVAAEGSSIQDIQSLQTFLDSENIGKTIVLDVVRGGQIVKISIIVAENLRS